MASITDVAKNNIGKKYEYKLDTNEFLDLFDLIFNSSYKQIESYMNSINVTRISETINISKLIPFEINNTNPVMKNDKNDKEKGIIILINNCSLYLTGIIFIIVIVFSSI